MKLLYTGATKQGAEQLNPDISLGGFPSSSQIPNDYLSSIFSTASLLSIQNKRKETKLIALQNDHASDAILRFKFFIEDDSICNYKVAFVYPTISGDNFCFESIINAAALPYYGDFYPIENGSEFSIPDLKAGSYLGIWLTREYNYDSQDLTIKTDADWITQFKNDPDNPNPIPNTQENFSFDLKYSLDSSISNS